MGWSYLLRRLAQVAPALGIILLVTFVVVHLAPGDPAGVLLGEYADQAAVDALNAQWGLDQPMWGQFVAYAGNVMSGDLGTSFIYGQPVLSMIGERLFATVLLTGTALAISVGIGILTGIAAARRPAGLLDSGVTVGALLAYSVPAFWLGQVAILTLGLWAGVFPVLGMTDSRIDHTGLRYVADVAHHLVLPALVLAASEIAMVTRLTRTGLISEMGEGYARTAEAKGLPSRLVLTRHAFPNAALPLVTVLGSRIGFLFSGAIVVETVFTWPGLGLLLLDAINSGDRPVVLGMVLVIAVGVLLANLVTDLVYARIDPRVRLD